MDKLWNSCVWVFGLGGIGSYVVEALARSGIGNICLVDNKNINPSHINRQAHSTINTIGKLKTDSMKMRALEINPSINITTYNMPYSKATQNKFDFSEADYIVDTLGDVNDKALLVEEAYKQKKRVISALSPRNRLSNFGFIIVDISEAVADPEARELYEILKAKNVDSLKYIYNPEKPKASDFEMPDGTIVSTSCSFFAPIEGFMIAGEVIKELIGEL